jgi:branched-subunit amino acid transport protein
MTPTLLAVGLLAVGTYLMKAVGPVASAGRALPAGLARFADLVPAALLAALVATQTFVSGTSLTLDARAAGVGVAALAVAAKAPFPLVVLLGAGVTALVRLAGWG